MWLIVTSEPENKFGKKAVLDKMPWKLMIDSMQLSLRNIVKSQVSASGMDNEINLSPWSPIFLDLSKF